MSKLKIGHRIILIYSALSLCVAGLLFAVSYYWMSDYTNEIYYSYLEDRAYMLAKSKLDKELVDSAYSSIVRHQDTGSMIKPALSQIILNADNRRGAFRVLSRYISPDRITDLYNRSMIKFKHGQSLGVAICFPKAEGNFIVIVMSQRHIGMYMHRQTGYWLWGVIALCAVMIFLVSKLYALRRINMLDEAYHREKQFVHHASHELNNPLTAIQGECEIALLKPRSTDEYVGSLQRIGEESRKMAQIIRQLLYLSTAMDGLGTDDVEPVMMSGFVRQFGQGRVEVSVRPGDNSLMVRANPFLLKMAVSNIVGNALKYSSGQVKMTLDDNVLKISDRGIGIPAKELPYVLQPFYRAANTRDYRGNGVGMSLASRIFKIYGVDMKIESRVGEGTTVILKFKKRKPGST